MADAPACGNPTPHGSHTFVTADAPADGRVCEGWAPASRRTASTRDWHRAVELVTLGLATTGPERDESLRPVVREVIREAFETTDGAVGLATAQTLLTVALLREVPSVAVAWARDHDGQPPSPDDIWQAFATILSAKIDNPEGA